MENRSKKNNGEKLRDRVRKISKRRIHCGMRCWDIFI